MEEQLMTFSQACKYLNVSRATLYRYAVERKVPAYKMVDRWRFRKKQLDLWLEGQSNMSTKKSSKSRCKCLVGQT